MSKRKAPAGTVYEEETIDPFLYERSPKKLTLEEFLQYLRDLAEGMEQPEVHTNGEHYEDRCIVVSGFRKKGDVAHRRKLRSLQAQAESLGFKLVPVETGE